MTRCEGPFWADMATSTTHDALPSLEVTLAGVTFRTPIALAPIGGGSHFGRRDPDPRREFDVTLRFLLDQVSAGSSCLYFNFSYLTEATYAKVLASSVSRVKRERTGWTERFMRTATAGAPYGLEGLFSAVSPGPSMPDLEAEEALVAAQARLIEALKQELPENVRIVEGSSVVEGFPKPTSTPLASARNWASTWSSSTSTARCKPACATLSTTRSTAASRRTHRAFS